MNSCRMVLFMKKSNIRVWTGIIMLLTWLVKIWMSWLVIKLLFSWIDMDVNCSLFMRLLCCLYVRRWLNDIYAPIMYSILSTVHFCVNKYIVYHIISHERVFNVKERLLKCFKTFVRKLHVQHSNFPIQQIWPK